MSEYLLKVTNTYRVSTVQDALNLREALSKNSGGELTAFSYTTKYIKEKGQIVDEYQVCKATLEFNKEKEVEHKVEITYEVK